MSKFRKYRDESRIDWGVYQDDPLSDERIQLGAILRIADAAEKMAKNHESLLRDLAYYKRRFNEESEACKRLNKCNAALRGVITKLKKATP